MKLSLRLNVFTALRLLHALVVAALVAGCIHLGTSLYEQFYLPYNLEDTPITPEAAEAESPAVRGVLRAAEQLQARLETTPAAALADPFWPDGAPTSTRR